MWAGELDLRRHVAKKLNLEAAGSFRSDRRSKNQLLRNNYSRGLRWGSMPSLVLSIHGIIEIILV